MAETLRCGCTDAQLALAIGIRWSDRNFTWAMSQAAMSYDPLEGGAVIARACSLWSRVCGATFGQVDEDAAEIIVLVGRGRRAGFSPGVLAWCEVGPQRDQRGSPRATQLMFNLDVDWRRINIVTTATHELGHGLCFMHEPEDSDSIMAPAINPNINEPRPIDVQFAQQLYGRPAPKPLTPDPTTPVTKPRIRGVLETPDGRKWRGDFLEVA